jgi:hypothetical protein
MKGMDSSESSEEEEDDVMSKDTQLDLQDQDIESTIQDNESPNEKPDFNQQKSKK